MALKFNRDKNIIHVKKRQGNTVGSRGILQNWNTREIRELRKKLQLSEIQKAVLVGLILGDGSIIENAAKKNCRLKVEQGKNRKEYVLWLRNLFKEWVLSPPSYDAKRNSWKFYTISHPEITEYRRIFYTGRKKIIPNNIENYLKNPISLAIWFMDDGGVQPNKTNPTISTHSFSKEENNLLIKCFKMNFGLKVNLNWDSKGYRLYIPKASIKKFLELTSDYIIPIMRYKFPLTP